MPQMATFTRPTQQPHSRQTDIGGRTFGQAYTSANPTQALHTRAGTPFTVEAGRVTRGKRAGEAVLIFRRGHKERARAYACCWGHNTNCNRTYIDVYTSVVWG